MWLRLGFPKTKLVIIIPMFAYTYTLKDETRNFVGAATTGSGGTIGEFTKTEKHLSQFEVRTNRDIP